MKLKHMSLALALAGMVSVQAQASEVAVEAATPAIAAAPVNAVAQDDLVALFGAEETAKPLQLAALSDAEMRETEGAIWWMPIWWGAMRLSPHIPTVGVWALNQSPRLGSTIDRIRHRR